MNRDRLRAALVIAAIVVGSGLAGAGIDRWLVTQNRRPRGGPPGFASPEQAARRRHEMLDRMTRDLELSTAQRAGIDSVMQRTDSALRVVRGEVQPRIKAILDSSRAHIAQRLDSTQRAKFAKMGPRRRGK